jgi:hypothetical protein
MNLIIKALALLALVIIAWIAYVWATTKRDREDW